MLGNPVQDSFIQSYSDYVRGKWDGSGYIVTAPFGAIDAAHPTPHQGIDIGNGRCGGRVLAMATGKVIEIDKSQGIVRIDHPGLRAKFGGRTVVSGSAHLSAIWTPVGAAVRKGQIVGAIGQTGASICHLHQGFQVGGAETNWWGYLDQNQPKQEDSMTVARIYPYPGGPKTWTAKGGKTTGWKLDGTSKTIDLKAGSQAKAIGTANIEQSPKKAPVGHGFIEIANGGFAGYFLLPAAGTVA